MYLPDNALSAIVLMFITMLCWGSWANTMKIDKEWRFELFYWDYSFGVLLLSLVMGLTFGTLGHSGTAFIPNLFHSSWPYMIKAIISGGIFNLANILLVAAISIAGMAVAFPIGIGIALVFGTVLSFAVSPKGNPLLLFVGVGLILIAVILDGVAYKRASTGEKATRIGITLSVFSGILMSLFYPLVAESMLGARGLNPYGATFLFAIGLFLCNLVVNFFLMKKPITGGKLTCYDYRRGTRKQHFYGVFGGMIWCLGMSFNVIAATRAGPAIAYAFGQGATLIAAIWGVFVWREFKEARRVQALLTFMFLCYLVGLVAIGFALNP